MLQLRNDDFDKLFHSPLKRAAETAAIVWADKQGPVAVQPSLREVDLYHFQVRVGARRATATGCAPRG